MKTIEEKALAYYKSIEALRSLFSELAIKHCDRVNIKDITNIFSELKESEDERIRKSLAAYFAKFKPDDMWDDDFSFGDIVAWLEKQGGHAKFRNFIQVGDKVTRNEDGVLVNLSQLERVAKPAEKQGEHDMGISEATKQKLEDNLNKALEKETAESFNKFLDEQKPAETEKGTKRNDMEIPNSIWSEKDEAVLDALIRRFKGEDIYVSPNSAVEFLESIKDRVGNFDNGYKVGFSAAKHTKKEG